MFINQLASLEPDIFDTHSSVTPFTVLSKVLQVEC